MAGWLELLQVLEALERQPKAAKPQAAPQAQVTPQAAPAAKVDNFDKTMRSVLHCYHGTARYKLADVIIMPWERQDQYEAQRSALVKIEYSGVTGARYIMNVAIMARPNQVRADVVYDNARIEPDRLCNLRDWVKVEPEKSS
jgi:hypothetical protein